MRQNLTRAMVVIAFAMGAGVAAAKDMALVVSIEGYDSHPDVGPRNIDSVSERALEDAGFQVIRLENLKSTQLGRVSDAVKTLRSGDRILIALFGHIVSNDRGAWLLARDVKSADDITVGTKGLSIDALLKVAGEKPGEAVVLLAPSRRNINLNSDLTRDYVPGAIPQGVTVLTGGAEDVAALLTDGVLEEGRTIGSVLETAPDSVAAAGYVPLGLPFTPGLADAPDPGLAPSPEEQDFWASMVRINSQLAYESYLNRYPQGAFRAEAEDRLAALSLSPEAMAAAEEESLGLSRDSRREIQRNLSLLGYDTRGIDGIFGRGTRAAIIRWQVENNADDTGYLTGNQVTRIAAAAERRAAELEEEARQRQEEQDRQDMAYWRELGLGDSEPGLRAYLERYPDGIFSDVAKDRLSVIDAARAEEAAAADRDLWEEVAAIDTVEAYETYLTRQPEGAFVEQAKSRIAELTGGVSQEMLAKARSEESRVLSNPITRLITERRLQQLGLEPGSADGRFDEDTRKAVRRFQKARDLPVTGYVTQATLVRLLASN